AALKRLTLNKQLDRATFLSWRGLFDGKGAGLLHKTRKWCPDCVAEASESARPITSLLLWACASVTHCHIHLCPLEDACAKCGAGQFPLAESAAYGRCQACGATLGWRSGLLSANPPDERQQFVLRSVLQMLEQRPDSSRALATSQVWSRVLREVADAHKGGSMKALGRDIHIDGSVLRDWAHQYKRPRFDTFVEVCYRLGTKPVDLLSGRGYQDAPSLKPGSLPLSRPTFKLSAEQLMAVETEIDELVTRTDSYCNLTEFAAQKGTSVGHLMYQIPDACKKLLAHRVQVRAARAVALRELNEKLARSAVRQLVQTMSQFPRRRLAEALLDAGTCIRNPHVRQVAFEELEIVRKEAEERRLQAKYSD
ncbi:MAG: hypothetical protein EPO09_09170, partial [Aquabacterium sp.]